MFSCPKGLEKKDTTAPYTCGDRNECWYLSCGLGGTCHNIDFGGGFYCECPVTSKDYKPCTNCTCDNLLVEAPSYVQIGSRAILVIMTVCMLLACKNPLILVKDNPDFHFHPQLTDSNINSHLTLHLSFNRRLILHDEERQHGPKIWNQ